MGDYECFMLWQPLNLNYPLSNLAADLNESNALTPLLHNKTLSTHSSQTGQNNHGNSGIEMKHYKNKCIIWKKYFQVD